MVTLSLATLTEMSSRTFALRRRRSDIPRPSAGHHGLRTASTSISRHARSIKKAHSRETLATASTLISTTTVCVKDPRPQAMTDPRATRSAHTGRDPPHFGSAVNLATDDRRSWHRDRGFLESHIFTACDFRSTPRHQHRLGPNRAWKADTSVLIAVSGEKRWGRCPT